MKTPSSVRAIDGLKGGGLTLLYTLPWNFLILVGLGIVASFVAGRPEDSQAFAGWFAGGGLFLLFVGGGAIQIVSAEAERRRVYVPQAAKNPHPVGSPAWRKYERYLDDFYKEG